MRRIVLLLVIALLFSSCRREEALTLLERLERIPGLTVTAITPPSGFAQAFQVDLAQAIDHGNPARGTFPQRFYLSYRGEDAPTVFYTSGYGISRNYESEPAALLQANQVLMVHRYFPDAVPSATDWSFLSIAQAAADQHEVRSRLAEILPGKWLSSGASKGGMTALYYRYHYPADVTATVAYVAPIMERSEDPRFASFLLSVGSAGCREKIRLFQREVLERRAAMLALVHSHALQQGYAFTVIREAEAFEYAVLEYPFAFWQYGSGDCTPVSGEDGTPLAGRDGPVPGESASDQELFDHLVAVSPLSFYADAGYGYYRPLFYQAYTEIGYCTFMFEHLGSLLQEVPAPSYRAFAPRGVGMDFRPEVMQAVIAWLRNQGERIIYIYGALDPWTAGTLGPAPGLDALQVIQPGANHGVKIKDLDQKGAVIAALERWLELDIDESRLASIAVDEGRDRF